MEPSSLKTKLTNPNNTAPSGEDDYENINPETSGETQVDEYIEKVRADFRYDLLAHDNYIQNFDSYEAMLISRPYDSVSKKIQNGLSDGRTTTIYQERAARVCGQLPKGSMRAAGKKDEGVAAVLDIIRQKYVYPHANAQAPLLRKYRNWQFYASVYGYMPMFYDWEVNENNGYIGPQCWLWHPRNFVPQIGRASIEDMDYCTALTFVSEPFLKNLLKMDPEDAEEGGWDLDEVKILCDLIEERLRFPDSRRDSLLTRERQSQAEKGRIMLATRYEAGMDGNWVTIAPEYNGVCVRSLRNPHQNGKIPFVIKAATDTFDNFYNLGDFQRAKPLQFFSDGLDNFYAAGLKRGLYPPTIINPAGVVKSSITQDPGAIWQETVANSIREYATSPVGLNTYQAAKTMVNAALLNQAGTTDMASTDTTADPASGKSPQGIAQQAQRESARDNQDRFDLESAIEILEDRMMGLFGTMATENINIDMFAEDFKEIAEAGLIGVDDNGNLIGSLAKMLDISESKNSAKMTIKPAFFKNLSLRFEIDPNSTASSDKRTQLSNLENFVQGIGSLQNVMTQINDQGWMLDVVQLAKLEEDLGDVPEMGKIFRKMTPQEQQAYQQSQQPAPKPPTDIDTTAYKDLPEWAQMQRLQKEGYTVPPNADFSTTDDKLKAAEFGLKAHEAIQPKPEATPPPEFHNGKLIKDPVIADAHKKVGAIANGR